MSARVCDCVFIIIIIVVPLANSMTLSRVCVISVVDVYVTVCVTIQYYDKANDLLYLSIFFILYVLSYELIYMDSFVELIRKLVCFIVKKSNIQSHSLFQI